MASRAGNNNDNHDNDDNHHFGAPHDHYHDDHCSAAHDHHDDNRSTIGNNDDGYSAAHDHHDNAARTGAAYRRTSSTDVRLTHLHRLGVTPEPLVDRGKHPPAPHMTLLRECPTKSWADCGLYWAEGCCWSSLPALTRISAEMIIWGRYSVHDET